jgi:hypothetical protein
MATSSDDLENMIQGTWWLLSREDHTKDGQKRIDSVLGADPVAILVYAKKHFAAQFMKTIEQRIQLCRQQVQGKIIQRRSGVMTPISELTR